MGYFKVSFTVVSSLAPYYFTNSFCKKGGAFSSWVGQINKKKFCEE